MTASTTKDNGFITLELMKLKELKEKWKILAGNNNCTRERSRVEIKNLCKII
jgi:ribosomal protein L32E